MDRVVDTDQLTQTEMVIARLIRMDTDRLIRTNPIRMAMAGLILMAMDKLIRMEVIMAMAPMANPIRYSRR
ncbi:hypothetical protein GCM10028773_06680 [Spirosoma koreense]